MLHAAGQATETADDYRLEPFGPGCADRSEVLARLHADLLAHSPIALLGPDFMQRFYYRVLPQLGLICGQIAMVDGRPAGFIVATHDASGFMQSAIRRRFLGLCWVLTTSMLRQPGRAIAVWEALQILRGLPRSDSRKPVAELLSFGVLPAFRSRDFVARRRLKISQDLLRAALLQLDERDASRVRVIVDADNLEARLFYLGNGWKPGAQRVPGWRRESVEFLLER
jgi:ribosomal protein S18 acetylase RimI-like enzyme